MRLANYLLMITEPLSAAHQGPFAERMHGHTWEVTVWVPSRQHRPDDAAFARKTLRRHLSCLEHSSIDEALGGERATDEGMCAWLAERWPGLARIRFYRPLERQGVELELR